MGYTYIFLTILLTVYGQLVLKWRMSVFGPMPDTVTSIGLYLIHAFLDFFVLSAFAAAFLASLAWMAALTKFDLSTAYPFTSVGFVLVLVLSVLLLGESMSISKFIGTALIVAGVFFLAR